MGDGARCDAYRVNRESEHAFHVATTQSRQGRDSTVWHHAIVLGSGLARHDLRVALDGTGGEATLNGFARTVEAEPVAAPALGSPLEVFLVALRLGVGHVEHPQQSRPVQRCLGLFESLLVDVGDRNGAAVRRKPLR